LGRLFQDGSEGPQKGRARGPNKDAGYGRPAKQQREVLVGDRKKPQGIEEKEWGDVPTVSKKEAIALQLLVSKGEMYGLEMVRTSEGALKRGTIYVLLDRMQTKGLVESRTQETDEPIPGLPRPLYKVTGYGVSVLKAWRGLARLRPASAV
jgi:hypothetical protein